MYMKSTRSAENRARIWRDLKISKSKSLTLVCLIDEQGLISAPGGKKIKKLINAQGLIITML